MTEFALYSIGLPFNLISTLWVHAPSRVKQLLFCQSVSLVCHQRVSAYFCTRVYLSEYDWSCSIACAYPAVSSEQTQYLVYTLVLSSLIVHVSKTVHMFMYNSGWRCWLQSLLYKLVLSRCQESGLWGEQCHQTHALYGMLGAESGTERYHNILYLVTSRMY